MLLQTAQTLLINTRKQTNMKSHILFDGGSQMSYVTPRVKSVLGYNRLEKRNCVSKHLGVHVKRKV